MCLMCRVSERATRRDHDLYVQRSRTEMGKRRFACRGPVLYNSLPSELRELPIPLFRGHLRKQLLDVRQAPGSV